MQGENLSDLILLLSCPDRPGLVSNISRFIYERNGNILDLDEHVDPVGKAFFIRVAWTFPSIAVSVAGIEEAFRPLADDFGASWILRHSGSRTRIAVFVSRYDHCLQEILWRNSIGEFPVEIALIVSNHSDLSPLAARYGIPFHVFPVTAQNKHEIEDKQLELLVEKSIDTVVLARYMQILSPRFVALYPSRIINIHHSFLPAFVGGNPYRQAYERGVKIIGATSHYVTEDLDQGPIIEQDIIRVSHKDTLDDLIRKGRDLERLVLAKALRLHASHRILVNGKKTVVFD
ncbi:MAG: formyltetrahydrofolate deformylase [Chlorobiaceae bacterium]|nr:formyltetrahydrofolate deformylase [Chlorobiaceae bacterium]NTW10668.1 formyltetrahydrofolate deformylase [Chlorobiaceae bacterium]